MKIHTLQITGFGPFAGTEDLDFDGLERAGLFLLTGPTGSGKTTVLDAICFALYGKLPRSGGKQPDPASDYRDPAVTPRVVLEATIGGNRLRINRVPKHMRPAKRGDGLTQDGNTVTVDELVGGEWKTISTALSEANAELEARVGMDSSQFSQVVMLPQGEFANFLKATVDQRRALLERLFPTQDLAYVEDWLKRRSQETAKAENDKLEQITHCLVAAGAIVEQLVGEDGEPVAPRPDAIDGERIPEWRDSIVNLLERLRASAYEAEKNAGTEAAKAEADYTGLARRADLIAKRIAAEARRTQLLAEAETQQARVIKIEAAERARAVSPLARIAQTRLAERRRIEGDWQVLSERLEADPAITDLEPEALDVQLRTLRSEATTLVNFEHEDLVEKRSLLAQVKSFGAELQALAGTDSGLGAELAAAERALESTMAETVAAKSRHIEIRRARTAGMAAELAGRLEPGAPCMVCGSTEHPDPAVALEHAPTEADEKAAERAVPEAEHRELTARTARDEIQARLTGRKVKLEADLDGAEKTIAAITARESTLLQGAATIAERRERVEATAELIGDGLATGQRVAGAVKAHTEAVAAAEKEAAANGFESLDTAAEAMLPDQELGSLKSASSAHREGLATITHQLTEGELAEVDPDEVVTLDEADSNLRTARAAHREALGTLTTRDNQLKQFTAQCEPIPGLMAELVPLSEEAARAGELSNLANGKNRYKMELSIYVLAARLKQVIEAANRRLEPMSNGQYQLVYSGELIGGNAASGLGIQVLDAFTSQTRETVTLSGGESFYASLALALGLAEVVQRETGGRKIETLFIDEGFGTLDPETLDQVMNEIDSLRENGRTVGLVSHVEELRNRIPTQIQVIKSERGSTTRVVGA